VVRGKIQNNKSKLKLKIIKIQTSVIVSYPEVSGDEAISKMNYEV